MKTAFHFMMFKTFHAQRNRIRQNMQEFGLSPGQPKVLRYVAANRNCMLKEIAAACDVECATVSRILNNLEEQNMLKRHVVETNKRALSMQILPKGEQALAAWETHCHQVEAESLQGFSEQEKEQFREYLGRMYHNLTGKTLE